MQIISKIAAVFFILLSFNSCYAQRQMEYLNRGLYAVNAGNGKVFISWRLLGDEADDITFNLYRTMDGKTTRINQQPLKKGTNFTDQLNDTTKAVRYSIKSIIKGKEKLSDGDVELRPGLKSYVSIPLKTPAGYAPNDVSVGDVDGDGTYELIVHQSGRARDNSQAGITDAAIFQCYKLDGSFLWEINLGRNIREGAHYTQFMVYDLDGDGKAEIAMKTADGTIDGKGKVIGDSTKDYRFNNGDKARDGKVLDGPEYFTIFDGLTGAELATTNYIAPRGDLGAWGGGGGNGGNDNSGNRADRFLACVAYLDGVHPSVIMCRGYYGRTVLAAWDWRNKKLTSRWVFDSKDATNPFSGQGNHNLFVADVDHDGKDEIVYGSMCVDDDGKGLYSTGMRHGDAVHVTDMDPSHPGMEVFGIHEIEEGTKGPGVAMYDAATGKILWSGDQDKDVGRGMSADIDPNYAGYESWGGNEGLIAANGERIGAAPRSVNFRIWWDDDLLSELLDKTRIDKWDFKNKKLENLFDGAAYNCLSNNGTKATPALSADLYGDWREEVIFRTADNKELRIFSTTIATDYRFYTLMHNPQYRLSISWQNVGYNQPPYTDYFLGDGMQKPPKQNIIILKKK